MNEFYPEIEPYQKGMLKVSDIHEIYYEQSGNPNGQAVIFLHGGPGAGTSPYHRRFFDPKHYRIVLLDQRGSGKSKPLAELRENTTWDLVSDIEKVRSHLKIDKWVVFGGSWGSTLALAYAIKHTERVKGLILRGIFLCRPWEIDWLYQKGTSALFPDYWDTYLSPIPKEEQNNMVQAYYKRLTSDDYPTRLNAAKIWSQWEAATSRLIIDQKSINDFGEPDLALSFARIECHYFINNAFFSTDNWLLENVSKIKHLPGIIVQGRYDVVCPAQSAWELKKAWPDVKFTMIADAGHSATEPGISSALIQAADEFRRL